MEQRHTNPLSHRENLVHAIANTEHQQHHPVQHRQGHTNAHKHQVRLGREHQHEDPAGIFQDEVQRVLDMNILMLRRAPLQHKATHEHNGANKRRKRIIPHKRQYGNHRQNKSIPIKRRNPRIQQRQASVIKRRHTQEHPRPPRILRAHSRNTRRPHRDPRAQRNRAQHLEHHKVHADDDEQDPQRAPLHAAQELALLVRQVVELRVAPDRLLVRADERLEVEPRGAAATARALGRRRRPEILAAHVPLVAVTPQRSRPPAAERARRPRGGRCCLVELQALRLLDRLEQRARLRQVRRLLLCRPGGQLEGIRRGALSVLPGSAADWSGGRAGSSDLRAGFFALLERRHDRDSEHGPRHAHDSVRRLHAPIALVLHDVAEALLEDMRAEPDREERDDDGAAEDHHDGQDDLLGGVERRQVDGVEAGARECALDEEQAVGEADGFGGPRHAPEDEGEEEPREDEVGVVHCDEVHRGEVGPGAGPDASEDIGCDGVASAEPA